MSVLVFDPELGLLDSICEEGLEEEQSLYCRYELRKRSDNEKLLSSIQFCTVVCEFCEIKLSQASLFSRGTAHSG